MDDQTLSLSPCHTRTYTLTHIQRLSISLLCSTLVTSLTTEWKEKCSAGSNTDWQAYLYYWLSYVSQWKKRCVAVGDRTAFDADECRVSASTPLQRPAWTDLSRDSTGPDVARLAPQITFPIHLWKLPCFTEEAFRLLAPARKDAFADRLSACVIFISRRLTNDQGFTKKWVMEE